MSDVPSSGWCTNWEAYNTPRLWSMVAGEDNPEAWKQVIAWREVSDAVDSHLARLTRARDSLASAWPPEQNEASRAFATRLNTLIVRMEGAREEASSTSMALDNILQALRQAKQNIEPLWQRYRDKNEDVVPEWWDNAEEELDAEARAHMISAERVVQQYVPSIKVPDAYEFVLSSRLEDEENGVPAGTDSASVAESGLSGGAGVPTPHSPPPPLPGHASSVPATPPPTGNIGIPSSWEPHFPDHDTPAPSVIPPPSSREPSNVLPPSGPDLSEVLPTPSPSTPGPSVNPPLNLPSNNTPSSPGFIPGIGQIPIGRPAGAVRGATPAGGLRPFRDGLAPVMLPGGVIEAPMGKQSVGGARGAPAMAKSPRPGWLPASGVGTAEVTGSGMPGGVARNSSANDDKGFHRFDPDNPWGVAQGVDPVIEPSRKDVVHDPGLGVIGKYR